MSGQEIIDLLKTGGIGGHGMARGEILDESGIDIELVQLVLQTVDLGGIIGVVRGVGNIFGI